MKLSQSDLKELTLLAQRAAKTAGEFISGYDRDSVSVHLKQTGNTLASKVVTEVDTKSQSLILEVLEPSIKKFDLAVLSEEKEDDESRLKKDYFWCVDPLDGTLAFTENQPGYAVSIALVSRAGVPHIGIVYDPRANNVYSASLGGGVYKNGKEWKGKMADESRHLSLYCDRSLLTHKRYDRFNSALVSWATAKNYVGNEVVSGKGAVMNAISVLENPPACYFKPPKTELGGGSSWDFAATACIFTELGSEVSDFEGKALDLNRVDSTFMNHRGVMFATNRTLPEAMRRLWCPE